MNETKFTITIGTKTPLTTEEISEALHNFKSRLEGYETECPVCLENSDMKIEPEKQIQLFGNIPVGYNINFFPTETQEKGSATLLVHPDDLPEK